MIPGTAQCTYCHRTDDSVSLSFSREQIFGNAAEINPIQEWIQAGLLQGIQDPKSVLDAYPELLDLNVNVADRARAYVAVNCSGCHSPTGNAPGGMDFRKEVPSGAMGVGFVPPSFGNLGLTDPFRVMPGAKEQSVFWERMRRDDHNRMPALGSYVPDQNGIDVIGQWIDSAFY